MEREELVGEVLKGLGGVLLLTLATLMAASVTLTIESLVDFRSLANLNVWMATFAVTVLSGLGVYLVDRLEDKRIGMGILLLFSLLILVSLNLAELDNLVLLSITAGGIMGAGRKVARLGDVWDLLRKVRLGASLVFFPLIILIVAPNAAYYNDIFLEKTVELVNSYMPAQGNLEPLIDQLIPPYLTKEDLNYIYSYLYSLPEWNSLSKEEKQLLLEKLKENVLKQKELIRNILKESMASASVKLDKETLLKIFKSNPNLASLLDYLYVFLILFSLAIFSIVTEITAVVLFLILILPEWLHLKKFSKTADQQ